MIRGWRRRKLQVATDLQQEKSLNSFSSLSLQKVCILAYLHIHIPTKEGGGGRLTGVLGSVSTDSLFRGKLSTFNFQLSLPSYESTGRQENGKTVEERGCEVWWKLCFHFKCWVERRTITLCHFALMCPSSQRLPNNTALPAPGKCRVDVHYIWCVFCFIIIIIIIIITTTITVVVVIILVLVILFRAEAGMERC